MSYDFYVTRPKGDEATQLRLLTGNDTDENKLNEYLRLVHKNGITSPGAFNNYIAEELKRLRLFGLYPPNPPTLNSLPPGAWFLQFTFTLAKPWISKDDDSFYVAESVNPVRKDKVFKIPMMSASSWKGLLRWTAMRIRLEEKKDELTSERFAQERFVQTLLFGDERGEEGAQAQGFAKYIDVLQPLARADYERWLRRYYNIKEQEALPNHRGRLMFYPTFFDKMDVEVINPHKRETKAGTHPIYLECVPAGATGVFSLLYVPFDLVADGVPAMADEAGRHLRYIAPALRELFLTYGFSAKRSSGYGTAEESIQGKILTQAGERPITNLSRLTQEVKNVAG